MNEKSYGGDNGVKNTGKNYNNNSNSIQKINISNKSNKNIMNQNKENNESILNYIKAGKIAQEMRIFAKKIIKKNCINGNWEEKNNIIYAPP